MGLYINNLSGYGFGGTAFESLEEDTSLNINEGMTLMEAAMNSIAITEENWNNFQREIALAELAYVEETGEDFVYTEATGTGFIAKAKEFFKKIWEKIKALFRKFLVILGSYTKDDKEFVKKYSKDVAAALKNIPKDASVKGYTYTLQTFSVWLNTEKTSDVKKAAAACIGAGSTDYATIGAYKDYDFAEAMDTFRGAAVGQSSGATVSEFSEEVFKMLRNGQDSKDDIDLTASLVNSAMGELQGMKTVRKNAKDAYSSLEKIFKKLDKELEDVSKNIMKTLPNDDNDRAVKNSNAMVGANRLLSVSKGIAGAMQTANGIFLTACKEASRQYKAICVKVVTYRNIKESGDLEGSFNEGAGTDMFAGVVLR